MESEKVENCKRPNLAWLLLVWLFPIPLSPWWLCIVFLGIFCFLAYGMLNYEEDSN
jgi:hypothetical protein